MFTTEQVIEMFKKAHPNENLDYSQVEYKGMHEKVKIICHDLDENGEEYGEFWQEANAHLKGSTHPRLGAKKCHDSQRKPTEEFIKECKKLYPDEHYSFDKVKYVNNHTKVIITCNHTYADGTPHGDFLANPGLFLRGRGCPMCANRLSKVENSIYKYLQQILGEENVVQSDHSILGRRELDVFVPSRNFAIEYNGLIWHSSKFSNRPSDYHLTKTTECNAQDITLFQVFEDEYLLHKDLVFDKVNTFLHHTKGKVNVDRTKCKVKEIDNNNTEEFFNKFSFKDLEENCFCFGLFEDDKLVSAVTFKQENNKWIIDNFAYDIAYVEDGIYNEIFTYFKEKYQPREVIGYLERRWASLEIEPFFDEIGFLIEDYIEPQPFYTSNGFIRLTEKEYEELEDKTNYYRIYDCGLIKYVWKNGK